MRWGFLLLAVAIGCALAACGEQRISLVYTPVTNVAVVPGADRVTLDVVAQDKRAQFADRVGTGRGSSRRIVAANDVADLVRSAVEHGLKDQGFVLAAGGLIVTVELQNFYCDYSFGTSASVAFTVRVRDSARHMLYTRYYEGSGKEGTILFKTTEHCEPLFEQAIQYAVNQVIEDKALQTALLSAAAKASTAKGS